MSQLRTVEFTQMKQGTRADYALVREAQIAYERELPNRIMTALQRLGEGESLQGFKVSRLEHSLQTATRAENDQADLEMVVAALVHDLGDELATVNHSQMAAAIIRPYVRPEVTWIVEHHGLFQMQYYAHHQDLDPNGYLAYRDHRWFASCQRFVESWDQAAFDPDYPTKSLSHFEPKVREIFSRVAFDLAVMTQ
jgi:predicted HD phosphohydrolase